MSMFQNNLPGGIHQDVLNATPEDDSSRKGLCEEIKSRAKAVLQSKNYPEAVTLYSKAIDVLESWEGSDGEGKNEMNSYRSILHANRSMCYLGMGKPEDADEDGRRAIELDDTYAKGYYRRGMALMKLYKWEQARDVFSEGLKRKADDKELLAQLEKASFAIANPTSTPKPKPTVPKAKTVVTTTAGKASSTPATKPNIPKSSLPPSTKTKSSVELEDEDDSGEKIRGYKLTSDGRKTTFFNHELDEATKELIGDIAPKRLDSEPNTASEGEKERTQAIGSAWNSAGTFESTSLTKFAHETLSSMLRKAEITANGCTIKVTSATITGDGETVAMRGKRKHIYDFQADLEWSAVFDNALIKGKLGINDIEADEDSVYDIRDYSVTSGQPSADQNRQLQTLVKSPTGPLSVEIKAICDKFRILFKAK